VRSDRTDVLTAIFSKCSAFIADYNRYMMAGLFLFLMPIMSLSLKPLTKTHFYRLETRNTIRRFNPLNSGNIDYLESTIRKFVMNDFGIKEPELLSPDFISGEKRTKKEYISFLSEFYSTFRRSIPDINLNIGSITILQPDLVSFIVKPTGTLSGPFSFGGEVYLPSDALKNKKIEFSPALYHVQIKDGKVTI